MRKPFFLYLLILLACASIRAEEIHLKDGTKINGKIVSVTGDSFRVKTAYGEIQVPRQQIVSITFPENEPKNAASDTADTATPQIDESLQGTSYTNETKKFHMTFPEGWSLAPELRAQSKDIAAALQSRDQTLFFFATPEPFAGTLATYTVLAETQFQSKFKDYAKISQSEIEIDGKKAIKIIWHSKSPQVGDALIKAVVYIVPYEGRMVRLMFLTLEQLFDESLPAFEKSATTFHSDNPDR